MTLRINKLDVIDFLEKKKKKYNNWDVVKPHRKLYVCTSVYSNNDLLIAFVPSCKCIINFTACLGYYGN